MARTKAKPRFDRQRGVWRFQYWADGKWHREIVGRARGRWRTGDPEPPKMPPEVHAKVARLVAKEEESRRSWGRGIPDSLATFLRNHLGTYQKPKTREAAGYAIESFLGWCQARKITTRSQVDSDACADFIAHVGKSLAASTVKMRRGYIAAAWTPLVKRGIIPQSPWTGVDPVGQDRTKPKNAWTKSQFEKLVSKCDNWLVYVLKFGVHTGLRIESMMKIEWRDWIKPDEGEEGFGFINVRTEICKTKGYTVPVSPELHDILCRRMVDTDPRPHPTYILTGKAGKPLKDRYHTHKAIELACERAELDKPIAPNHHMRRTFGRWAIFGHLTGRPIPLYAVSRWMGHSDPRTTLKYLDLTSEDSTNWMLPDPGAARTSTPTPPGATSPS